MIPLIIGTALLLSPVTEASETEKHLTSNGTATLVSLDVNWDPGDTIGAKAEAPPEPEPEPDPEPETEETEEVKVSRGETAKTTEASQTPTPVESAGIYSLSDLMFHGVINWNGYKYTYYSQSVLSGPGLSIPGRHVNSAGYVSDGDGYISLAAARGIPHGSVFPTPFGAPGKVYDTCASCSSNWLDVYTR